MLTLFISTMDYFIGYFYNLSSREFDWKTVASFDQKSPKRKISQWDISKLYSSTLVQYFSYHPHPWLCLKLAIG